VARLAVFQLLEMLLIKLGMVSSPAFVRQPEGNGCVERFLRTLKEQLLWLRNFRNLEELR
jgi:putative transposase